MLGMSSPFHPACLIFQTVTSTGDSPALSITSQFSFVRTVTVCCANT